MIQGAISSLTQWAWRFAMGIVKPFSRGDGRYRPHPRRRPVPSALFALTLLSVVSCGSGSDGSKPTAAPSDQSDLVASSLPDSFGVDHVGLAGGFGWLVLDGDDSALWRVAQDGSVTQAPSVLANFSVSNVGRLGDGLVLSGLRCDGPSGEGECESTAGIVRFIEPDGSQRWEVELWSIEGQAGDQEAVPLVGATDDELWATSRDGELGAISPEGKTVRRLPPVVGDPCLINGSVYALSRESLLDREVGDSQVPPTASADVDEDGTVVPQERTFVVQEPTNDDWQVIEGTQKAFLGGDVLGRCADGGFEVFVDGQPIERWTEGGSGWEPLPPAEPVETVGGSEAVTFDGAGYLLEADTGAVLRRTDDSSYMSTGIAFEFAIDDPGPGVGLVVAEEDQLVFACGVTLTAESGQSACSFGKVGS